MQHQQSSQGKLVYLRDWVGQSVVVVTVNGGVSSGKLTNIAFDEKRLMYIVLDDRSIVNFDHVISIKLEK